MGTYIIHWYTITVVCLYTIMGWSEHGVYRIPQKVQCSWGQLPWWLILMIHHAFFMINHRQNDLSLATLQSSTIVIIRIFSGSHWWTNMDLEKPLFPQEDRRWPSPHLWVERRFFSTPNRNQVFTETQTQQGHGSWNVVEYRGSCQGWGRSITVSIRFITNWSYFNTMTKWH